MISQKWQPPLNKGGSHYEDFDHFDILASHANQLNKTIKSFLLKLID